VALELRKETALFSTSFGNAERRFGDSFISESIQQGNVSECLLMLESCILLVVAAKQEQEQRVVDVISACVGARMEDLQIEFCKE